jgi:hypothetical protein
MYWNIGEAALTIIAASIPVLRVLVVSMISGPHQTADERRDRSVETSEMSSTTSIVRPVDRVSQDIWILTTARRMQHPIFPAETE